MAFHGGSAGNDGFRKGCRKEMSEVFSEILPQDSNLTEIRIISIYFF
jgi:hypothetical protein